MSKRRERRSKRKQELVSVYSPLISDWSSESGNRFRRILNVASKFLRKHNLTSSNVADEAVDLAKAKVRGAAHKDVAAAVKAYMETEQIKLNMELQRRLEETTVLRQEAETRLAVAKAVDAEFELLKKLTVAGVGVKKDNKGNWMLVPLREGADLTKALEAAQERKQPVDSADPVDPPSNRISSAGA